MVWTTDADNAKELVDVRFLMICAIIDQLALNLVDICFDNTLQILCILYYALQKLSTQKSPKFDL